MEEQGSRRSTPDAFDFEGDGEDARDWLDTAYGAALGLRGRMGTVHHRRRERGGVAFDRLRIDESVSFDAEPMPVLVVVDVLAGEIEYTRGAVTDRGREGDTVLAAGWGMAFSGGGNGYDVRNTSISLEVLSAAIADIDPDKTSDDLRFDQLHAPLARRGRAVACGRRPAQPSSPDGDDQPVGQRRRVPAPGPQPPAHLRQQRGGRRPRGAPATRRDATQSVVRLAQRIIDDRADDDLTHVRHRPGVPRHARAPCSTPSGATWTARRTPTSGRSASTWSTRSCATAPCRPSATPRPGSASSTPVVSPRSTARSSARTLDRPCIARSS